MMWYSGNGGHWWGMLIGFALTITFWGVIVWAVWYFVTSVMRQPEQRTPPDEAKRILDERLARGEIDAEEYGRLRDVMRSDGARGANGQTAIGTGGQR
jgi:putative membrane protein